MTLLALLVLCIGCTADTETGTVPDCSGGAASLGGGGTGGTGGDGGADAGGGAGGEPSCTPPGMVCERDGLPCCEVGASCCDLAGMGVAVCSPACQ